MPSTVNSNLASLAAQRSAGQSQNALATSIGRLSSGLRIQSARDDAAGLAIADRLTSQIRGVGQAGRNANDGISLVQTAEGALASVSANLQRMRELAVQSANGTNSASDRASLQAEVAQLAAEVDRIVVQTQFNGVGLLDGSFGAKSFQVGANAGESITVGAIPSLRTKDLAVYQGFFRTGDFGVGSPSASSFTYAVQIGTGPVHALGYVQTDLLAMASAINNGRVPGLSATTGPTRVVGTSAAAASASGTATFSINGATFSLAGTSGAGALAGNRAVAVEAINAKSAVTGVVAADNGTGVTLTAADGRNVYLSYTAGSFTGSAPADFGLSSVPISAGIINTFYEQQPGQSGDAVFLIDGAPGLNYTFTVGPMGTPVAALDISTVAGANNALASIDRSLATVSTTRSSLGAAQNRFASALATLQTADETLSASRGRIQDADFAQETANLSRAQILQQASTAMVAQANQLPRNVMQLLR